MGYTTAAPITAIKGTRNADSATMSVHAAALMVFRQAYSWRVPLDRHTPPGLPQGCASIHCRKHRADNTNTSTGNQIDFDTGFLQSA